MNGWLRIVCDFAWSNMIVERVHLALMIHRVYSQMRVCLQVARELAAESGLALFTPARPDFLHLHHQSAANLHAPPPSRNSIITTVPTTRTRTRNRSSPAQKRIPDICAYCAPALHHTATQNRRDKLSTRNHTIETATAHWTEENNKRCPWSLRDHL